MNEFCLVENSGSIKNTLVNPPSPFKLFLAVRGLKDKHNLEAL